MSRDDEMPSPSAGNCEVGIATGLLAGRAEDGVKVFKAIPYAAPPVEPLRFRPPQPPEPWDRPRPAAAFAPASPQPPDAGFFPGDPEAMPSVATDEDCLYLNVWAPADGGPYPVLIWLHGGAQILGGTARPVYDGAVFARQGIVCVTVGFRLGALGGLELGELLGPAYAESGNNRLADQLAALAWVHDNIAGFGGDPARVTLGGESAGAKDVAALMAAPRARGLFGATILQSGGGETTQSFDTAQSVARRFLAVAGISAQELLTMPAGELLAAQGRFLAGDEWRFPFRPIWGTVLLPEPPLDGIRQGRTGTGALLVGTTRDEFVPAAAETVLREGWQARLLAHRTAGEMAEIETRAIAELPDLSAQERRRQLLIAEEYWVPSIRVAEAHAATGAPTWMYRFDLPLPSGPFAGSVPHNAQLAPAWARTSAYDALNGRPAARMHDLVVRFVKEHRADWPVYAAPDRTTALIAETLTLAGHPGRALLDLLAR